jgi:putative transposase
MGSPRICDELRYQDETCGRHRVARRIRAHGLQGVPHRRRRRHKPPGQRPSDVQNHLSRDFNGEHANSKRVTDITYIRTAESRLYLCVVIDLYLGIVVGWSMSLRQDRQLVLQAVFTALWPRRDKTQVVLHSDRGCQFTSEEYLRFLRGHNLICSMSAVATCADNAAAESILRNAQARAVNRRQYRSRAEARSDVFEYIERFQPPSQAADGIDPGMKTFS